MSTAKIAVSLDPRLLAQLDRLVAAGVFPNRSNAIQQALQQKIERIEGSRLALESAKLDVSEEQAISELGLASEVGQWPGY